jgi:hypothetical protein
VPFSRSERRAGSSGPSFILGMSRPAEEEEAAPSTLPGRSPYPPARTARKAHARLVLLSSGACWPSSVQLHNRTQARSRLGGQALGDNGLGGDATQAGKQEHELLPLQAGSEGSCSRLVTCLLCSAVELCDVGRCKAVARHL